MIDIEEDATLTLFISIRLGNFVTQLLEPMEPAIDECIKIVRNQMEIDPENHATPVMLKLLTSSKDFIEAHKLMFKFAEMAHGGMEHEGSDTIQ